VLQRSVTEPPGGLQVAVVGPDSKVDISSGKGG